MIISKTPLRLSLLGGGSDHLSYLETNNKGMCIGSTINKFSYLTCRYLPQFHPYKTHLSYSEIEKVQNNSDIQHKVIKAVLDYFKVERGFELLHAADMPSKTGTGSSSAFLVGLINAVAALIGQPICPVELANVAIHIEQDILQETVGLQDSLWAAYGGLKAMYFGKKRYWQIQQLSLNEMGKEELESHLLLFFTGIHRVSSEVASTYVPSLKNKIEQQKRMVDLAERGLEILQSRNFCTLGTLLHESWLLKRSLSPNVSTPKIDELYTRALSLGAIGGKLCGIGGGGSLLICCEPGKRECIINGMKDVLHIPFKFTHSGSQIIMKEE